jgi:hypothetical protein
METQKTSYIPTVNGVPVSNWDATVAFTTDPIEFPYSIAWSLQWHDNGTGSWSPSTSVYSIKASNTTDVDDAQLLYINGTKIENIELSIADSRIIQDQFMGFRYIFIVYQVGEGSPSGNITLQLSK